jgi:arylsulfatase A-like enzyme
LKKRDYHVLVKGVFELTRYREFDPSDYQIDTWLRRATPEEIRRTPTIPHIPMEERLELLSKHLHEASEADKPVFVWMHVLRPHRSRGTFIADKRYPFGKSIDNLYDAAIANADDWLAEIRQAFSKEMTDDREVVWVVMSDHGAGMSRGDKRNVGKTLYDDQVRVPLIISGPGIEPGELRTPVDVAVDISATLLDLVGIAPPEDYDGISLLPLITRREAEASLDDRLIPLRTSDWDGGVLKGFKYIKQGKSVSLFDTNRDPDERKNLADEEPEILGEMRKRVKAEHLRQERAFREGLKGPK